MKPAFTAEEYLSWVKSKPPTTTYDGCENYTCPIAQFLLETGRAVVPYVLSEEWYDETLLTKKGKPQFVHRLPDKVGRATFAMHPVNTFRHIVVRLELLIAKLEPNDFYFILRAENRVLNFYRRKLARQALARIRNGR